MIYGFYQKYSNSIINNNVCIKIERIGKNKGKKKWHNATLISAAAAKAMPIILVTITIFYATGMTTGWLEFIVRLKVFFFYFPSNTFFLFLFLFVFTIIKILSIPYTTHIRTVFMNKHTNEKGCEGPSKLKMKKKKGAAPR